MTTENVRPLRWSDGNFSDAAWRRAQMDAEPMLSDYPAPRNIADDFANSTIVHARRICLPCEEVVRTGGEVQLYSFGFNDGACVSIDHGCEHFIRECYPGNPPPREWLAERVAEAVQMVNGQLVSYRKLALSDDEAEAPPECPPGYDQARIITAAMSSAQADHIRQAWYMMDGPADRPRSAASCWEVIEGLLEVIGSVTGITDSAAALPWEQDHDAAGQLRERMATAWGPALDTGDVSSLNDIMPPPETGDGPALA